MQEVLYALICIVLVVIFWDAIKQPVTCLACLVKDSIVTILQPARQMAIAPIKIIVDAMDHKRGCKCNKCIEETFMAGNIERFEIASNDANKSAVPTSEFESRSSEGAAGLEYGEYIKGQTIDATTLTAHHNFVENNVKNGFYPNRGASMNSAKLEDYDLNPWRGLRRPAGVPVYSPDQVHDVNVNVLSRKNPLNI